MSQIEVSEKAVAMVVDHLAENGVFLEPLYASKFFPDGDYYANRILFECAIEWLEAEGIIRFGKPYMGGRLTELIRDTVLTGKGHALLSQQFKSGLKLREAVRQVSSGKGYSSIGDFVGGLLGGFTKSIGS